MIYQISNAALALTVVILIAMCFVQSEYVSWRYDKCGCVGVFSVGTSAAYMLLVIAQGEYIHPAAGMLVAGFALWLTCRRINHARYPRGPLGPTDRPPLGDF